MKPAGMTNISVFGSKKDMAKVIEELYGMGSYHIVDHTNGELEIGNPMPDSEEIASALVKAKSLLSLWKAGGESIHVSDPMSRIIKKIHSMEAKNKRILEKKNEATAELNSLLAMKDANSVLKKLRVEKKYLELDSLEGFVGSVKSPAHLKEKIAQETKKFELRQKDDLVAVFTTKEDAPAVQRVLQGAGFSELNAKNGSDKSLNKKISRLQKKLKSIERENNSLIKKNQGYLLGSIGILDVESTKAQAPLKFGVSNSTFYIKGYVPTKQLTEFRRTIEFSTRGRVDLQIHEIDGNVPIKMDNPGPTKNFQFLMDLYSLPKYTEVDPTMLTFLTFPILFGFMLGDIGYGVTTLILFLALKKMLPGMKSLLNILVTSSLWTIVFGALFGEVFGEEIIFGYDLPRILSRLHQINDLLILSLAVGVVHLNLGLLVGFYNEYKAHGFKTAFYEKISWMFLQGAAALLGVAYMLGTIPVWIGYVVLAISVYMIFKGEGVKGLIELPAIFSNILSYARLMAIGLASAGLAIVVNQFAKDFFAMGPKGWLPMVLILIVGHGINIALGILSPFLHSLRLHYVEFFTKFYKGGGKPYNPFGTEVEKW